MNIQKKGDGSIEHIISICSKDSGLTNGTKRETKEPKKVQVDGA